MSGPKISVVIGCFNQRDALEKVLSAYSDQSFHLVDFEVIVVDSGSTDGTHTLFDSFQAQFIFRPIIQENSGKAGARNRGVREAHSSLIIITDADMIPDKDFVASHYAAHQATDTPSCFEGVTFNMDRLEWPIREAVLSPYITRSLRDGARLGWYYFLTGNLSFPKAVFDSENGFDMAFQGYGWEDLELGYRLSKKKIPLYYLKSAVNYHYHVISEVDDIERNVKKGESARVFLAKHPELKWFLGLNPLSVGVFRCLNEKGRFLAMMQRWMRESNGVKQRFSLWFLKEYFYLKGVLK